MSRSKERGPWQRKCLSESEDEGVSGTQATGRVIIRKKAEERALMERGLRLYGSKLGLFGARNDRKKRCHISVTIRRKIWPQSHTSHD